MDVSAFTQLARTEFMQGKIAAEERVMPANFDAFCTRMPSTVRVETHTYMSSMPRMELFRGYAPGVFLTNKEYTVTNKEYRVGVVRVKKTDIDDDQVGGYVRQIGTIPQIGIRDTGFEILKWMAAGASNACFDGSNFFADSHNVGTGDNQDTYSSTATSDSATFTVVAMVTTNPTIKPLLVQDREPFSELLTDANTPQALKLKEYEYWADGRFGLGYGYWWDAVKLSITNTPDVSDCQKFIRQIINLFRTFRLPVGRDIDTPLYVHEGWTPSQDNFVLACSMGLGEILRAATFSPTVAAGGGGAVIQNPYYNVAQIVPTSALN